ncbi:MAG: dicarboxylate/amino acid:cation symporter [Gemmatimonadales bacterium]|jgi:Na+/H+-dicarboxylate symporter|nr:dicarboxylate/amino acid:cation symporter [Gemmatimonadales bacterium]MDG2241212.1 dicarboxylate/amino acid:cation symporter [Longimicrobiales bacterium]NCG32276.1 cation:dicarboxylase symporter family transporter [Pseudomonadota bacterium]MBT3498263.1 dicarboxylate/amino acid:cation symporter [Gemmatimonadales bacterium]MBT3773652.1 dicarboxylate/amino acid:cation symporter [Gemmatimonadales bacterium]
MGDTTTRKRWGLGTQILIGMMVGSALGAVFGESVTIVQPLGDLFIRLLVLAAVPLIFFNLLAGLTTLSDVRTFGRLATKTMSYFVVTDLVALSLGMGAMLLLKPGVGMQLTEEVGETVGEVPAIADVLLGMVPTNIFEAFAAGNVVQLVVVSVFLGVATLMLRGPVKNRLSQGYQDLAALFRRLVDLILLIAPVGIAALMAVTVGRYGTQLIGPMTKFLVGVWACQFIVVCGYMILLRVFTDRRPLAFLRDTGLLWATTAATTSSLASLSVGLEMAEKINLPRQIYSFTLPLGAQLNKDGTAVMLGAVLIFTAQAAGVSFSPAAFVTILLVGLLLSEGSGGIPGGGFVIALIFVQAFNLPIEIAAIVGGIYRLVDMGNTTVNIMGDMVGTSLVAQSEVGRA